LAQVSSWLPGAVARAPVERPARGAGIVLYC